MAINVPIGSTTYSVPQNGSRGWGTDVTTLLVRLSNVCNQVVTANYVITTDTFFSDVSGTYGLKSNFLKGVGAIASADGFIRMASPHANPGQGASYPVGTAEGKSYTYLSWRNSTNSADLHLFPNSNNITLQFAGKDQLNVDAVQTVTNKIIGATNTVDGAAITAGTITNAAINASAAIALSKLAAVTASRLLVSDASGFVSSSSVTTTEAGYLSGVTSSIQTQIDAKQASGNYLTAITGDVVATGPGSVSATIQPGVVTNAKIAAAAGISVNKLAALTLSRAVITDGSGFLTSSAVTSTEMAYISGVTSAIQTQLNNKQPLDADLTAIAAITDAGYLAYAGAGLWLTVTVGDLRAAVSPLTTKGDLWTYDTVNNRLPIGSNGFILSVDTTTATGLKWIANSGGSFTASSTDTLTNKSISGATNTLSAIPITALSTFTSAQLATQLTDETGTGANVFATSPTLVTPILGTPASATLTNATGLPLTTGVTGTLPIGNGGTGQTTANLAFNALSPATTKGDLVAYGTTAARLAVGSDNQVLVADSTQTLGVKWASASSGEKNYLSASSNSASGWTASGAGITVTTETSAANLPDNSTQTTAVKFLRASGADYAYARFTLDKVDYNKKLKIQKDMAYAGTAGDYTVRVFSNTASNYAGTSTELTVSPSTSVPTGTGQMQMSFDSSGSTAPYLEIRVYGVAGTTALYVNNFIVGPGVLGQQPAISEWQTYTPALTNGPTTSTNSARWRRVGSSMEIVTYLVASGAGAASQFGIQIPTGYTLEMSAAAAAGSNIPSAPVGQAAWSNGSVEAILSAFTFTPNIIRFIATGASAQFLGNQLAGGHEIGMKVTVPIAEWVGTGTLNIGAGAQVEYAYNTSTSDTTDTTSFGTGSQGVQMSGALTASRTKVVRFSAPIQTNDLVILEFANAATGPWTEVGTSVIAGSEVQSFLVQNTGTYGARLAHDAADAATDIRIQFGQYRYASGATFGAAGDAWSTSIRWRVRKANASSPVGFGLATATDSGISSGNLGFPGTVSGVATTAGKIGETFDDATSAFWTTTASNILSRTLQPGKWRITGRTAVNSGAGPTGAVISISATSATNDANTREYMAFTTATGLGSCSSEMIVNISSPTTYYLVGASTGATFSNVQLTRLICQRIG